MKRLLFALLIIFVCCEAAHGALPAVCNTVASDNFQRPNESPLSDFGNWTTPANSDSANLVSHQAVATSTGGASRSAFYGLYWTNDQCSVMTVGTGFDSTSILGTDVRMSTSANTEYEFIVSPTSYTFRKVIAGSATNFAAGSGTFSVGDVLAIAAVGTTITAYQNGNTINTATDSSITLGVPGFILFDSASPSNATASLWTGGGTQGGVWQKIGPIIPPNVSDYNAGNVFSGTSNGDVLFDSNAQILGGNVFKMWFMGTGNLYYAESSDAIHWVRRSTALLTNVGLPKVFKNGSTYYLYASANPTCNNCVVSSYTSTDGINWTLQVATALNVGASGHFDSANVQYLKPFLLQSGTWYATYSTLTTPTDGAQLGIATSTDLLHWTNGAAAISGNTGAADPHVIAGHFWVWTGGNYVSTPLTGGPPFDGSRIDSPDMVTWTSPTVTFPRSLFFEGVNFATGAAGPQVLVEANGNVYNFYTATRREDIGIGYVQSVAIAPGYSLSSLVGTTEGVLFPQNNTVITTCNAPVASDNFTRANESPLSDGGAWSVAASPSAQINLVSDNAVATSTSGPSRAVWTQATFPPTQCSEQTISGLGSTSANGVDVRMSTSQDTMYEFLVVPDGYELRKVESGVNTDIEACLVAGCGLSIFGPTQTIALSIVGRALTATRNGVIICVGSDPDISSGQPGIELFDSVTPANSTANAWAAGAGGARNITPPYVVP